MIYFIKSTSGHIKIGYTDDHPEDRIKGLQCGCPFKLKLLAALEGDRKQERFIHKKFKYERVRGEWFNYTPEIKKYIDNPSKPSEFDELKKRYGSHCRVAVLLGITPRHYVRLRKGETPLKKPIIFLIEHLLREKDIVE